MPATTRAVPNSPRRRQQACEQYLRRLPDSTAPHCSQKRRNLARRFLPASAPRPAERPCCARARGDPALRLGCEPARLRNQSNTMPEPHRRAPITPATKSPRPAVRHGRAGPIRHGAQPLRGVIEARGPCSRRGRVCRRAVRWTLGYNHVGAGRLYGAPEGRVWVCVCRARCAGICPACGCIVNGGRSFHPYEPRWALCVFMSRRCDFAVYLGVARAAAPAAAPHPRPPHPRPPARIAVRTACQPDCGCSTLDFWLAWRCGRAARAPCLPSTALVV